MTSLEQKAALIRYRIMEVSHKNKIPHLASSFSCVDILTALYSEVLNISLETSTHENRDRLILSKGHAASALYTTLAEFGFLKSDILYTHGEKDSPLEEHPSRNCIPGVETATGSLGHGLPIACGLALAAKIKSMPYQTYTILGDGECNEGTIWEAAMFASAQKLDNLCVFVDFNKWQATGRSKEVMYLDPLADKFSSFGWNTVEIDGHSMKEILDSVNQRKQNSRPTAIIAHTVKGKGVSFTEDDNNWHYRIPKQEELVEAKKELGV